MRRSRSFLLAIGAMIFGLVVGSVLLSSAAPGAPGPDDVQFPAGFGTCIDVGATQVYCPAAATTTTIAATTTTAAATTTTAAATTTTAAATTTTIAPTTTTTAPPAALHDDSSFTSRNGTGPATTTIAVTCPAGKLLTARVVADADNTDITAAMSNSGAALSWHTVGVSNTAGYAGLFWTACDGASHTYTATMAYAKPVVLLVDLWSNANLTTPFPTVSVKTGNSGATLNVSYPATVVGSAAVGDVQDWANQPNIASTTTGVKSAVQTTVANDAMFIDKSTALSTSVGQSQVMNVSTGPAAPNFDYVLAELVPAAGGGGGTTTTTAAPTTTIAATTTTAAATTTTVAPSGRFHTVSTSSTIVNPAGGSFKPKGVNCGIAQTGTYPPTGAYTQGGSCDSTVAGHVENHAPDALTYGFNIVRMNLNPGDNTANIQAAINHYSAAHIVAQLDCHQDLGGSPSFATWASSGCASLLGTLLDANKTNTYAWIEPLNEEAQTGTTAARTAWLELHNGVDTWVRSTHSAPDTMIVADMLNYGQNANDAAFYASFLTGKTNTTVQWHNYGGAISNPDGSYTASSDALRTSWANALVAAHVPVIVGETGYNIDGSGAMNAEEVAGFNWMVTNWSAYPFGGVFWHGTGSADARNLRQCSPAIAVNYDCAWYTTSVPLSAEGNAFMPLASSPV